MMDRAILLAYLIETWQGTPIGCEAQELDGFPIVHHGEKEKICRRGRNDMAIIHSPKARAAWEARGKMFVHHITSKSLPRRIGVFQLQHRVGYPRARQRFQEQARHEAPLRYLQAVRAKIKVRHQGAVEGKELVHGAARHILHVAEPHFNQAPTSINHNETMSRLHLERHRSDPHPTYPE